MMHTNKELLDHIEYCIIILLKCNMSRDELRKFCNKTITDNFWE